MNYLGSREYQHILQIPSFVPDTATESLTESHHHGCDQTCSLAKASQSLSVLQSSAQHCLSPHTRKANRTVDFCAGWPGFTSSLPPVRAKLLYGTRRGAWRPSCQDSADTRKHPVKLDDSSHIASSKGRPSRPQRKHKAYDAYLRPLGDCVSTGS